MAPPLFIGLLVLFNLTFSVEATESLKPSDQTSDHFSFKDKPWVDLKPSQEYFDIPSPTEEKTAPTVYSLRSRIDAYHAIQKTDKELLLPRLKQLKEIQETIKEILETCPKIKDELAQEQLPWRWHELQRHVDNRYWYLSQLYKLESQGPAEIFKSRLMPHFWGDNKVARGLTAASLSCEDVDPCHRKINPLYYKWYRPLSPSDRSYFMWLEGQDTEIMESKSPYNLQAVHLRTKTIYEDGKLVSDFLKDSLEGNYLYVLDLNQTLHVYPTELATRKTTQEQKDNKKLDFWRTLSLSTHNQFLNGDAVICAGECTIKEGKIFEIDNNSGHYRPSPLNLKHCLEILNHHHVVSDAGKVTIKNGLEIIKMTVSKFLSSKPPTRTAYNSENLNRMSAASLKKNIRGNCKIPKKK